MSAATDKPVRMYKIGGYGLPAQTSRPPRPSQYADSYGNYEQPHYSSRRLNAFEDHYESHSTQRRGYNNNRSNNNYNYRRAIGNGHGPRMYADDAIDEYDQDDYYDGPRWIGRPHPSNARQLEHSQRRRPLLKLRDQYYDDEYDDDEYDEYYDDDEKSPYQEVYHRRGPQNEEITTVRETYEKPVIKTIQKPSGSHLSPKRSDGKKFAIRGTTKTVIEVTTTEVDEEIPFKVEDTSATSRLRQKSFDQYNESAVNRNKANEDQVVEKQEKKVKKEKKNKVKEAQQSNEDESDKKAKETELGRLKKEKELEEARKKAEDDEKERLQKEKEIEEQRANEDARRKALEEKEKERAETEAERNRAKEEEKLIKEKETEEAKKRAEKEDRDKKERERMKKEKEIEDVKAREEAKKKTEKEEKEREKERLRNEKEAKEQKAREEAKKKADRDAKVKADREAREKAQQEAQKKVEHEAKEKFRKEEKEFREAKSAEDAKKKLKPNDKKDDFSKKKMRKINSDRNRQKERTDIDAVNGRNGLTRINPDSTEEAGTYSTIKDIWDPVNDEENKNALRKSEPARINELGTDGDRLPNIEIKNNIGNQSKAQGSARDDTDLKLPPLVTEKKRPHHYKLSIPNIPNSSRSDDDGYKRCPCLMHNRRYYETRRVSTDQIEQHDEEWHKKHDHELKTGGLYNHHHHQEQQHDHDHDHDHDSHDLTDMSGWNAHMRTHIRLNQPVCRGDLLKCKVKNHWAPTFT